MNVFKKATLATALTAATLVSASPAMAQNYRRGGDDTAVIAIGAGIVGLALGAIVASSGNDRNRHDDFRRNGYQYRDGYYWDRQGNRFDRQGRRFQDNGYYARRGYGNDRYNSRYGNYRGYGY